LRPDGQNRIPPPERKKCFASGKKKGIVTGKGFGRRTEKSP
jgi:hypothetical protein